jgi:uncharacterized protein YdhG (YjbR/CyaY superfamily)
MSRFNSVDSYIENFEGRTKEYLQQIRLMIRELAPESVELINYNIASFALVPGGKREEQIMIAGYKNHVGFYPHPTTIVQFWDKLDDFKKAKGSVQFLLNQPLPRELIANMIRYRLAVLTNK